MKAWTRDAGGEIEMGQIFTTLFNPDNLAITEIKPTLGFFIYISQRMLGWLSQLTDKL